jgi:hypothetical protein
MPRACNTVVRSSRATRRGGKVRPAGCLRVRYRAFAKAHTVCHVRGYVRLNPCARSRVERFTVHWFDPWLARMVVMAGRMH